MRMVEADDIFGTLSSLALDPNQLLWIYVITILRRIGARVAAAGSRGYDADVAIHLAEQHATAFVGIGLLAMAADFGVVLGANL